MQTRRKQYTNFAWAVVAYTVVVILWGAFVRATGSGAGCGSHWPTCNGSILPRPDRLDTIVEFAHRVTSAFNGLLVIGLLLGARRYFPRGHNVRRGALLSLIFIILEGLLGAALVRFEWVVDNVSLERVVAAALHLVNTTILLTFITLTAWWAGGGRSLHLRRQGQVLWLLAAGFVGLLLLNVTGAITALGDTVFQPDSLLAGIQADLDPAAHFLVRLRVWHPLLAIALGVYLVLAGNQIQARRPDNEIVRYVRGLKVVIGLQLAVGVINLVLLAPVALQIVHLLLANAVLICLVLLAASALSLPRLAAEPAPLVAARGSQ